SRCAMEGRVLAGERRGGDELDHPRRPCDDDEADGGDPEEKPFLALAPAPAGERPEGQQGGQEGGAAGEGRRVLVDVVVPPVGAETVVAVGIGGGDREEA